MSRANNAATSGAPSFAAIAVIALAVALRVAVVAWGARFPAAADGTYYDTLARRIASGAGYTWLWPDGAVTPVAHYPVGYPAFLALAYRFVTPSPVAGMAFAAIVSALAVVASLRILRPFGDRVACIGALLVAVHPALLLYTPALMTEGVTASLLLIAAGLAVVARDPSTPRPTAVRVALGLLLAALVYIRPQSLALAPVFAFVAAPQLSWASRSSKASKASRSTPLVAMAIPLVVAATAVLPWTYRNCVQMDRCALVSVNGGWNLLIGAETTSGAWQALSTPEDCRTVWSEAGKDACFERAARRKIAADMGAWIARVPSKWNVTFDYFGAAPWYLHDAAPAVVDERAKTVLGVIETLFSRLSLIAALVGLVRISGPLSRARVAIALIGIPCACIVHASAAYLLLTVAAAIVAARHAVALLTAAVVGSTFAIHAVFFGAGRYGLPVAAFVPLVAALAFLPRARRTVLNVGGDAASDVDAVAGSPAMP